MQGKFYIGVFFVTGLIWVALGIGIECVLVRVLFVACVPLLVVALLVGEANE